MSLCNSGIGDGVRSYRKWRPGYLKAISQSPGYHGPGYLKAISQLSDYRGPRAWGQRLGFMGNMYHRAQVGQSPEDYNSPGVGDVYMIPPGQSVPSLNTFSPGSSVQMYPAGTSPAPGYSPYSQPSYGYGFAGGCPDGTIADGYGGCYQYDQYMQQPYYGQQPYTYPMTTTPCPPCPVCPSTSPHLAPVRRPVSFRR